MLRYADNPAPVVINNESKLSNTRFKSRSMVGTRLLVKCLPCNKSFDSSHYSCPYCGWKRID